MKIFLTGASGLLGGNLFKSLAHNTFIELLASHRDSLFTIPHDFSKGKPSHLINLVNQSDVWNTLSQFQPDVIIHTAAMSEIASCEWNRDEAYKVNVTATQMLCVLAEMFQSRFIYISTDMVFDGKKGNYSESDMVNPKSYYAETKCIAEELVRNSVPNSIVLRPSIILGNSPKGTRSLNERLLLDIAQGKKITLFNDEFRSPIFADTLAQIITEFAFGFCSEITGLFHSGGDMNLSRYDIGEAILKQKNIPTDCLTAVSVDSVTSQIQRPKNLTLNSSKLISSLPFPPRSFDDSLRA